jgi:uncharacterized protein (UPF0212 family)
MNCPKCGYAEIKEEWVSCPKCGQPLEPPTTEAIVGQMVTKILGGFVEAGFIQERKEAEREKDLGRAQIAEVGRKVGKDIETLISEAIIAYDYQERIKRRKEKSQK